MHHTDSLNIHLQKMNLKTLSVQYNIFSEEITNAKVTVTLVNTKRVETPTFHGMTDLQIRDKVRSIIKAKIADGNNTQDEEELLSLINHKYSYNLASFFV